MQGGFQKAWSVGSLCYFYTTYFIPYTVYYKPFTMQFLYRIPYAMFWAPGTDAELRCSVDIVSPTSLVVSPYDRYTPGHIPEFLARLARLPSILITTHRTPSNKDLTCK